MPGQFGLDILVTLLCNLTLNIKYTYRFLWVIYIYVNQYHMTISAMEWLPYNFCHEIVRTFVDIFARTVTEYAYINIVGICVKIWWLYDNYNWKCDHYNWRCKKKKLPGQIRRDQQNSSLDNLVRSPVLLWNLLLADIFVYCCIYLNILKNNLFQNILQSSVPTLRRSGWKGHFSSRRMIRIHTIKAELGN